MIESIGPMFHRLAEELLNAKPPLSRLPGVVVAMLCGATSEDGISRIRRKE